MTDGECGEGSFGHILAFDVAGSSPASATIGKTVLSSLSSRGTILTRYPEMGIAEASLESRSAKNGITDFLSLSHLLHSAQSSRCSLCAFAVVHDDLAIPQRQLFTHCLALSPRLLSTKHPQSKPQGNFPKRSSEGIGEDLQFTFHVVLSSPLLLRPVRQGQSFVTRVKSVAPSSAAGRGAPGCQTEAAQVNR
jgi:hypothetical protein